MKRTFAVAFAVLALAGMAACSSGNSAVSADRAVCHDANSNASNPSDATAVQMVSDAAGATPSLSQLVTSLDNAVTAYQNAANSPGDFGGAFSAIGGEFKAFSAITSWCQSHGYSS